MAALFPSLISADLLALRDVIRDLDPYCVGYHLDVMDAHFVPALTWGTPFIDAIGTTTTNPLWVHLMVENPHALVTSLKNHRNTIVSFHLESFMTPQELAHAHDNQLCALMRAPEIIELITYIRQEKGRPSIAINPTTPIEYLFPFLPVLDHVLVMSVTPGKSGQSFLPETDARIVALLEYRKKHARSVTIGVDGGITLQHCARLAALGVEHFAAAAAIFHTPDPVQSIKQLGAIETKAY